MNTLASSAYLTVSEVFPQGVRASSIAFFYEDGTKLPFDQEMIPCHFWKPGDTVAESKKQ